MSSLLEVPLVRERVHRMTVAEYHRAGETGVLSDDVELLQGIVVTKMPKSPLHEFIAQKLLELLLACVPAGFRVRPERPLTFRDSEPEPDISVVKGKPEDWLTAHPSTAQLVIEVAVSSAAVDEEKAEIYAQAAVLEYWLVRAEQFTVDVYREPTPEGYRTKTTLKAGDVLRASGLPEISIPVSEIFPRRT
jgi:Uma2 family endonuclease